MFQQTFAITRNSFFESIRQPIMLVVLVVATLVLILSNPLAAFTMEDDQRMLVDMGLATVFLCGALLAAFVATNVLGWEIENQTALTVISKPVSRPVFVLGKYLGVAGAMTMGTLYMSFVFLLVEQHSVMQTTRDPIHRPVLLFGTAAGVIGVGTAVWCNYFYNKVFASTVICMLTPLAALAYGFSLFFDAQFDLQSPSEVFKPQLCLALAALLVAILVLTAIAVAASTRLGQVMTLCVTLGVFLLGMLSDWFFGRKIQAIEKQWLREASARGATQWVDQVQTPLILGPHGVEHHEIVSRIEQATEPLINFATGWERFEYALYWIGYSIVPNLQIHWLADALTQDHVIPPSYVVKTALYGLLYIVGALALATVLFQRREVG